MGKMKELMHQIDELKRCGEILICISEELKNILSSSEPEDKNASEAPKEEEKTISLEDVRAVMADKSRKGFTAEVKALLTKHGANKLSEVDAKEYAALLEEVGEIGNGK